MYVQQIRTRVHIPLIVVSLLLLTWWSWMPAAAQTVIVESQVSAGSDDAEQAIAGGTVSYPDGTVKLTTGNFNIVNEGDVQQVVGLRFNDIEVPNGAEIISATIQFVSDSNDGQPVAFRIQAQAADNPGTFTLTGDDVPNRSPLTTAEVLWGSDAESVPAWGPRGEVGPAQRTPNLAPLVQEVVDRAGWTSGNSMVFIINWASATPWTSGRQRIAQTFERDPANAPVLTIEYAEEASVVDAGPNQTVIFPNSATLAGTVEEDDLPAAATTAWSVVSGPDGGTVTFGDAAALDTTATFSGLGVYVLRLTVNADEFTASDDVTIIVADESSTSTIWFPNIRRGN